MKSPKNKTIDFSLEEGETYLARCISPENPVSIGEIIDRTICGDMLRAAKLLPEHFVDLLVADPFYNLSKDFHGVKFGRTENEAYEAYTRGWIEAVFPLLKPTASVYVCCDWKSGMVIGRVLEDYFSVRNRITWQREKGRGAAANWKNGLEDIWFATVSDRYTFHLDAVKVRRKVMAPYREKGLPKDWEETESGNFRNTCPSNFWDDISIPYWSMPCLLYTSPSPRD